MYRYSQEMIIEVNYMDITKYEVLLKVVDRGGLSQSAEDLGYTRSALSKMIASMEKEIGFPLVKRTRKGIVLNEEGSGSSL